MSRFQTLQLSRISRETYIQEFISRSHACSWESHAFLQIKGLRQEYDKNYWMADSAETMAETETELSESVEENKPQTSLSTTCKCSSRKFAGAASLPCRRS